MAGGVSHPDLRYASRRRLYGGRACRTGIFTSTGNVAAWFDTGDEALAALEELIVEEPEAADGIAAIEFDDAGLACRAAIKGSAVLSRRSAHSRGAIV